MGPRRDLIIYEIYIIINLFVKDQVFPSILQLHLKGQLTQQIL